MATLIGDRSGDQPAAAAALAAGRSNAPDGFAPEAPNAAARAGIRLWRLFTSVNFAVVQIIALALLAVVGMTVRQLQGFAFRSAGDYANEMNKLRAVYEPMFGRGIVDAMERLQLFHVFTSTWFSLGLVILVVSIVICTLDRTPRLWRQSAVIRVVQPEAYFDPILPDRVSIAPGLGLTATAVAGILRRHRFKVHEVEAETGERFIYGDRYRWTKLATLISHLGLILFLIAGLVTAQFGDEQGLVIGDGDTLTVQRIGTPGLLLVKNFGFRAPGLDAGVATDFTTDLAVYRDGALLARKTIRVNDPLAVAGYTFHQNGFGPAPDLEIREASGALLWSGPVPLTDSNGGLPVGTLAVPGKALGLQLLLAKDGAGVATLLVVPYVVTGTNSDGTTATVSGFPSAFSQGQTQWIQGAGLSVTLRDFGAYTLLIAKRDPGQGIVWFAFAALIIGLAITFYFPRRRIWTRLRPDGRLDLVGRADRQLDFDRELGALVDDLVHVRGEPAGREEIAALPSTAGAA